MSGEKVAHKGDQIGHILLHLLSKNKVPKPTAEEFIGSVGKVLVVRDGDDLVLPNEPGRMIVRDGRCVRYVEGS